MMKTALLVIDAQELITNDRLYAFDLFTENVRTLIAEARKNGVEVIYVRHDDGEGKPLSKGNDGFDIYSGFAPESGEHIFDKYVNSPFRDSGLLGYLQKKTVKRLIVTGLQTDYCMDATVKCGFEHGFEMIVPEYCNSTFDNDFMTGAQTYRYYNEFMWKKRYAKCVKMAEALELIHSNNEMPEFSRANENHIRRASEEDASRIAEILVFAKRMKYRSIFNDDAYSFGELQVLPVAKKYIENGFLNNMFLYDDGIIKGLIRIEKEEIIELYVDHFFQGQGVGSELIEYAKENFSVNYLWTIEKNIDAVRFYEAHGFHLTDTRKLEEGTTEYIVMMKR
ncbi:isochorismatase family protein [Ruminococcus flavefaciens]|uniref:isochorismatase family protein n=1 Tax=Ruminococcus flavefaciens TaxID=1265 RepID=UPI0004661FED